MTALEGRIAVVTGGASGIGRAIALELSALGADLAIGSRLSSSAERGPELAYLPRRDELAASREAIARAGGRVLARDLDVADDASVAAFCAAVEAELGAVDILVNAAGITAEQTVVGHSVALWQRVLEVNLTGTFRMVRACLPTMLARGFGRIVNLASTAASVGAATSGAYCASKAGVVGLTRCVALEGAPRGVTCNAISPGWVETEFGKAWIELVERRDDSSVSREQALARTRRQNPQGRIVQPQEVARLAAFLCSEGSVGITGQDITIAAGSIW